MTIFNASCFSGQLAFYDQVKAMMLKSQLMNDTIPTHLFSSFIAASAATLLTQPVDVLKTRMMNAKPGEFKSVTDCAMYTLRLGPSAFYAGLVPSFVRYAFKFKYHTNLT
jgi:dicarboxylate transporter 10